MFRPDARSKALNSGGSGSSLAGGLQRFALVGSLGRYQAGQRSEAATAREALRYIATDQRVSFGSAVPALAADMQRDGTLGTAALAFGKVPRKLLRRAAERDVDGLGQGASGAVVPALSPLAVGVLLQHAESYIGKRRRVVVLLLPGCQRVPVLDLRGRQIEPRAEGPGHFACRSSRSVSHIRIVSQTERLRPRGLQYDPIDPVTHDR